MFGPITVRVIEKWQADALDVFVFAGSPKENASLATGDAQIHRHVEGDVWRTEPIGEVDPFTQLPKPSFSIPIPVLEEVLQHVKRVRPNIDREDAVTDARTTRDKVLDAYIRVVDADIAREAARR